MGSRSRALGMICAATLALATTTLPASATGGPTTITDGIPMPLTVDNGPRGKIYVTGAVQTSPVDITGYLYQVGAGGKKTVLETYPGELTGVSVWGHDVYYIQTGAGGSHVVKRSPDGRKRIVSDDFIAYEAQRNPDRNVTYGILGLTDECKAQVEAAVPPGIPLVEYKGIVESHAYQMSVYGNTAFVADAAANAILKVNLRTKRISTVAVLPPARVTIDDALIATIANVQGIQLPSCISGHDWLAESVPTDVKMWLDGRLYVSTLGGILGELLPVGGVHKVDPWSGRSKQLATGYIGATGLDVSLRGDVYVSELFGSQVTVLRRGAKKPTFVLQANMPADVEVDGRQLLVTTNVFENGTLIQHRIY